jgi:hypothetical protein
MSVTFYGEWSLVIVSKNAAFEERVRIAGSAGSDGVVNGVAGQGIPDIKGSSWQAFMEWSSDGGANWYPSRIKRIPSVTSAEGLIITLFADDNFPGQGDGDYNDLIAQFVYLNRNVNPLGPGPSPYNFTLPKSSFWPPLGPGPRPDACECECICTCRKPKRPKRRCRC